VGGARAKKLWFALSCTQPEISYYEPTVPTESVQAKLRCTFWGSHATRYQEAQIGKPQTHEELWFQKLISSIPLNVEKFTKFNGTIFFISEQKMGQLSPENWRTNRRLELTLAVNTAL